jgi:hypothetical protein
VQFENNIHSWDFQRLQIAPVVFEKLTRACFSQIALETILLAIQIIELLFNLMFYMYVMWSEVVSNVPIENQIKISGLMLSYKTLNSFTCYYGA